MEQPMMPSPLCDKDLERVIRVSRLHHLPHNPLAGPDFDAADVTADAQLPLKPDSKLPCWTAMEILTAV